MRGIGLIILSLSTSLLLGQIQPGFNKNETKELLALCNSYTFLELYETDYEIIPIEYRKIYTSKTLAMDNKYQIYLKGNSATINFRGSTEKLMSWIENMYSSMISPKGYFIVDNDTINYHFANDTGAYVHAGYALATTIVLQDLLPRIKQLNEKGIYDFYITGHSQGGALAQLLMAQLKNLPKGELSPKNRFKVYAFANPMIGNQKFAEEYTQRFSNKELSFSIVNPKDPVSKMPITYKDDKFVAPDELVSLIENRENFNIKEIAQDFLVYKLRGKLTNHVNFTSRLFNKGVSQTMGNVIMPTYKKDIKYVPMNNRIELPYTEYPKIIDEEAMEAQKSLPVEQREKGPIYKKEPNFFQHKPYNYYVSFLSVYFPKEHKKLKQKYLPENL